MNIILASGIPTYPLYIIYALILSAVASPGLSPINTQVTSAPKTSETSSASPTLANFAKNGVPTEIP